METASGRDVLETFLLVAVLNLVIFAATAVFHEAGHAVLAAFSGCTDIRVVLFEVATGETYTAMRCAAPPSPAAMFGSAYLFVLPLALLTLLLTDFLERYLGPMMLGANMLGSSAGAAAFLSLPVQVALMAGGVAVILVGENALVEAAVLQQTGKRNRFNAGDGGEEQDGDDTGVPDDAADGGGDRDGGDAAPDAGGA